MTKPFSEDDLSNLLDQDLTWRLKEFSDMKSAIRRADFAAKPVLIRAFITLTYGHWEGYVKYCANKYFQHIALRKIQYENLHAQFYKNHFLVRLDSFSRSKFGIRDKCAFIDDIINSKEKRFSYINPTLVDTKSNLNSDVLSDICTICNIDYQNFYSEKDFIDIFILKRRNEIAHGEETYIQETEIDSIADRSIGMMRLFRNLLEAKAYDKSYNA